jgi:hypothetical protein
MKVLFLLRADLCDSGGRNGGTLEDSFQIVVMIFVEPTDASSVLQLTR